MSTCSWKLYECSTGLYCYYCCTSACRPLCAECCICPSWGTWCPQSLYKGLNATFCPPPESVQHAGFANSLLDYAGEVSAFQRSRAPTLDPHELPMDIAPCLQRLGRERAVQKVADLLSWQSKSEANAGRSLGLLTPCPMHWTMPCWLSRGKKRWWGPFLSSQVGVPV